MAELVDEDQAEPVRFELVITATAEVIPGPDPEGEQP